MGDTMKIRAHSLPCMLLTMLVLCVIPARAQLSTYVNDDGKRVFTNEDSAGKPYEAPKAVKASSTSGQTTPAQPAASPLRSVPVSMPPAELNRVVEQSAEKHHVDPALVRAVIRHESNWNSSAVSPKGALGLMQLIPGTAQQLGVGNAFDPAQNVDAGTRYLGTLLARYNGDLSKALAAYNAGPGAVDRFGGVPNFRETRDYVQKVTSTYFGPGSDRQTRAFFAPRPIYRAADAGGRVVFTNE
jgi:soluble lytic murein transglycosylase-like protein